MNRHQRRAEKSRRAPASASPRNGLFATAVQFHQSGRLGDAERLYRDMLALQPDDADALHGLGLLAHQAGRPTLPST